MTKILFNTTIMFAALLFAAKLAGQIHSTEQIEVELIAETTNVVPGETTWLAIRLDPIEHWHTYWKFGGDSGEATRATNWELPTGTQVGDIVWPIPDWTPFLGSELVTFTYEREVLLPIPLTIPMDFSGNRVDVATTIEWQVCEEICIPGEADFTLSLPVAKESATDPRWQSAFVQTRAMTPVPVDEHNLIAHFNDHDGKINVMVNGDGENFSEVDNAWFFPLERRIMRYAPYRDVMLDGSRLQISTEQHRRYDSARAELAGLLSTVDEAGNRQAYDIIARRSSVAWDHSIEVELVAETTSIVPGETAWLGLRLKPAEHWHTYWKMGGDSGEPTSLNEWDAPIGTRIGDMQWPAPYWLPFYDTDLVNFGYEEEVLHPVAVTLPADYEGDSAEFSTLAYWNVCEQICIPGEQHLAITLPVGEVAEIDATTRMLFADNREKLPTRDHNITSLIAVAGDRVSLGFEAPDPFFANYTEAWFFPDQRRIIKPGPLRDVSIQSGLLQITHQQPRRMLDDLTAVQGVLVLENPQGERAAFDFSNPAADANATTIMPAAALANGDNAGGGGSLLLFMGLAFLGGMILNLMPCVFPVLSIKALSFTKNAGESLARQRMDGIVYTAGVIVAFLVLASVLIALRAGGEAVGWAFQFQQPWFLAFIVYLFFTMGLSLSGVFEIGTGLMGAGGSLAAQKGYRGSFFTGVLATTVATPCTAPFMGPAIGFALSQPWWVALPVFTALGLGMAAPILLLSFVPVLFRYLPKPGAWMETFKQLMAFPLYASALFFLWVLGNQVGVMGMAAVIGVCVLIAFAAWLYQRRYAMGVLLRSFNYATGFATIALAIYLMQTPFLQPQSSASNSAFVSDESGGAGQNYLAFSSQRVDELRAEGRPVFVNMTADWCITCLANEQTSLGTERVQQSMADNDITYMKGDWTNEDPEITAVLEAFNRPSVPLYILYPGEPASEPLILPQILTPGLLTEAFESI
ncbi:MAG: protein-disulfide reductase DsbD family protein [Gammaproteobacteria bacterium]|nr:protein-disulfide reductase DsbD family protein [Gammaproteobacteria bacterium]